MEQAGIYSLKLYNVSDAAYTYVDADSITITAGTSIDIISENKPRLTITPKVINRKLKYDYSIELQFSKLTNKTITAIKANKYGWYAVITFNNGNEQAYLTPFIIDGEYTLNTNETNNRVLTMKPNTVSGKFKNVGISPII